MTVCALFLQAHFNFGLAYPRRWPSKQCLRSSGTGFCGWTTVSPP